MSYYPERIWLVRLKESRNLNNEQMAQILGIGRSGYSKIQNGTRGLRGKYNKDNHLKKLSVFFNIPLDVLQKAESDYINSLF